jgi:hypothetical protein
MADGRGPDDKNGGTKMADSGGNIDWTDAFDHRKCDVAVLMLGAGFSQPWGPPVMSEFVDRARFQYFNHRAQQPPNAFGVHYAYLLEFLDECRRTSWLFNRDWDNIEELYTQADLLRLTYPDGPWPAATRRFNLSPKDLCDQIAWAIWDVYRISDVLNPPNLGGVINAIRTAKANELRPAIITTNYDVLAESGLNAGLPRGAEKLRCFYPGFKDPNIELASSGFKRQSPTIFEDDPIAPMADGLVPIIKLHGSVNWFRTSKSDPPDQWLAFQNFGSREPGQFCGINKPGFLLGELGPDLSCEGFEGESVVPAIVPPMLGKSAVHPIVAAQWRAAIEVLRRAKTVDIIGYSFPETDAFMLRLLTEGLGRNQGIEDIMVVNRDDLSSEWRTKLARFFNRVALDKKVWYLKRDSRQYIREIGGKSRPDGVKSDRVRAI